MAAADPVVIVIDDINEPPAPEDVPSSEPLVQARFKWPLSFRIQSGMALPPAVPLPDEEPEKRYWNHTIYRGSKDEPVEVFYCKNKQHSEIVAQKFLKEPIVGFDGEWRTWNPDETTSLKDTYSLVQIACEDKIALFHIALHTGYTSEDLLAPSLRKIIESPDIIKVGVNIVNADFRRLQKYFKIDPQNALELSHLHHTAAGSQSRKLVALAKQVEQHLGLPLFKGDVRTSNWRRPLDEKQRVYAAADAYAGFMLYHCMQTKAEALAISMEKARKAAEEKAKAAAEARVAEIASRGPEAVELPAQEAQAQSGGELRTPPRSSSKKVRKNRPTKDNTPLDALSRELFDLLAISRGRLAAKAGVPRFFILHNSVLEDLARQRPTDERALEAVYGIGRQKIATYGAEWLKVIKDFTTAKSLDASATIIRPTEALDSTTNVSEPPKDPEPPKTPEPPRTPRRSLDTAFSTPPQLHTGLSFTMASTRLEDEPSPTRRANKKSEQSSPDFGSPLMGPSRSDIERKRKRRGSISQQRSPTRAPGPSGLARLSSQGTVVEVDYFDGNDDGAWQEKFVGVDYFAADDENDWKTAFDDLQPSSKPR